MAVMQRSAVVWVIVDPAGEVVLMCSGRDAEGVVDEWRQRGYRAVSLDAAEVDAA